jgi:hypothetical protein
MPAGRSGRSTMAYGSCGAIAGASTAAPTIPSTSASRLA